MNENRIQQVLEIEKQARDVHEQAARAAQQLPIQAEQEGQALIEKARAEAQEEARRIVAGAKAEDVTARVLAQAEEKNRQAEALAMSNFDRAVAYVLDRVINKE